MSERIGFYICHCGINIAYRVRVKEVAEYVATLPNVVISRDYLFMCSDPGQELIEKDIRAHGLTRVIVASCSPRMHEKTFRTACERAGLNPYRAFHMVSVREQVSWVTENEDAATQKAKILAGAGVARVIHQQDLTPATFPVCTNTLVVGGGIAGMQASLDIASAGFKAYLVERQPTIGGHMLQYDKTFPTLDCAACIGTPKMVSVGQEPNIELLSYSEVEEVNGFIGNFQVTIRKKARFIKDNCTGCGECEKVCPVVIPNEWDVGTKLRKAVYRPFPQAVPITYCIEKYDQAPCIRTCPAGTNVQGYVGLIRLGRYEDAIRLIMQKIPLPGTLGRICPAPCEKVCRRKKVDIPVAIRELKRFAADQVDFSSFPVPEIKDCPEKIAVVGSGPSGLSVAYYLRLKGYQVTIFEELDVLGGILRADTPDSRLPSSVLDNEINYLLRHGIHVKTGTAFGSDIDIDDLQQQGFSGIFLDIDTRKSAPTQIPGLKLTKKNLLQVDPKTFQTSLPGVFAAGNPITKPAAAIKAIKSAHKAVEAIHCYIQNDTLENIEKKPGKKKPSGTNWKPLPPELKKAPEIPTSRLALDKKTKNFDEANPGFDETEARKEASRCLNCGGCCECKLCVEACEAKAIDHDMPEEKEIINVGSIIVATGFDPLDPSPMTQYGYGRLANVFTNLEFERLSNATGPTGGKLLKRDVKNPLNFTDPPKSAAILHCIGSRDINYHEYCSRTCCMYALKYAHLLKDKCGHDTQVYNFYIDMRCFGKGYEEFYKRVQNEGVKMIRGKAARIEEKEGMLCVTAEDTLSDSMVEISVDMVILCTAMEPRSDIAQVARTFGIATGGDGFFLEEHPKLEPVSTASSGVFLAGACQGPKDIPDTVAQAKGAASEAMALSATGKVSVAPMISYIDPDICIGCRMCIELCPYSAIEFNERTQTSEINEAVCKGCGSCSAHCPSGAAKVKHFTDKQIFSEITGLLAG